MSRATADRKDRILSDILEKKHVSVRNLATNLGVSEATVRRDLKQLADQREVTLVHGGATLARSSDFSFHAKSHRNPAAKRIIGDLAANLVRDDEQIFLDSGTTCLQMATGLRRRHDLSVLATSVRLARELDSPTVNTILLGGQFRPQREDTVGPIALYVLENFRGYMAFIGADGVSQEFGLSASDIDSAHLYQMVVRHARETVLLVDSTKFAAPSLYRIAAWDQIDKVVTDRAPDAKWKAFFQAAQIEVIVPLESNSNA